MTLSRSRIDCTTELPHIQYFYGLRVDAVDQIASRVTGTLVPGAFKLALRQNDPFRGSSSLLFGYPRADVQGHFAGQPVIQAHVLDFYLANPEQIPEALVEQATQGKSLVFWGSIYRNIFGTRYVRALRRSQEGEWYWMDPLAVYHSGMKDMPSWLSDPDHLAVVLAT